MIAKHFFITALGALVFSLPAFATKEVGNGGSAVVCRDGAGKITSAELLDYFEARALRNLHIDLGDASSSVAAKFKLAMDRLRAWDAPRAARYSEGYSSFDSQAQFLHGMTLTTVPDAFYVAIPNGCAVEQLAIQKEPEFPGDKRFQINGDIWDKLSADGQSGLILHELIYQEALAGGAEDSVATRYFNALIASNGVGSLSFMEGHDLYIRLHFLTMPYRSPDLAGTLLLATSSVNSDAWLEVQLETDEGAPPFAFRGNVIPANETLFDVIFYPDGKLEGITLNHTNLRFPLGGTFVACEGLSATRISFFETGSLRSCTLAESFASMPTQTFVKFDEGGHLIGYQAAAPVSVMIQGKARAVTGAVLSENTYFFANPETFSLGAGTVSLRPNYATRFFAGDLVASGRLSHPQSFTNARTTYQIASDLDCGLDQPKRIVNAQFDPSGKLVSGMLAENTAVTSPDGTRQTYAKGAVVYLDETGNVIFALPGCR